MENQNQNPNSIQKKGSPGVLMVILVLVVLALAIWFALKPKARAPLQPIGKETPALPQDNPAVINQDLDSLNVSNLDQEFQAIDADLNNL